ncbi:hypothetical protein BRARA_D01854 [Brassica rapa]|uniref:Uncharacterized protein n=1 Tax=Brassica campestris TaxID=3711 RepID=A0A397ZUZ3_BRACM|nr:hypothetical protein BRARA_D01854 [Brassica rapa]
MFTGSQSQSWSPDHSMVAFCPNNNEVHIYKSSQDHWEMLHVLEKIVSGIDWSKRITGGSANLSGNGMNLQSQMLLGILIIFFWQRRLQMENVGYFQHSSKELTQRIQKQAHQRNLNSGSPKLCISRFASS